MEAAVSGVDAERGNKGKWLVSMGGHRSRSDSPRPPLASPCRAAEPPSTAEENSSQTQRRRNSHPLSIFTRWPQIKYTDIESRHTR